MKHSFINQKRQTLACAIKEAVPGLKKGREKSLISAREVKVNGARAGADIELKPGDAVELFVPGVYLDKAEIKVICSDEHIVIADKPSKVNSTEQLPALLRDRYGQLFPAHRLDTNTTGLIILARSSSALDILTAAFKERLVSKTYVATVCGKIEPSSGTIKSWLIKDAASGKVTAYNEPGSGRLEAVTEYKRLSVDIDTSVIELKPKTGRTHQLRVQLAHIGHPILGDGKYGDFDMNKKHKASAQKLRAVSLSFSGLSEPLAYLNDKTFKTEENYE